MTPIKNTLIGQRQFRIVYATWLPQAAPHAVVVLVHGYGEHMGRYRHVAEVLVERGYAVYTIDHRGHGESQGARASVERFDYFVADLHLLVQRAQADHPNLPIVMVGHSMGGLIAMRYALKHQDSLTSLVLSGPALQIGDDVAPWLKQVSGVLARIVPLLPVTPASASAESVLSRDPLVQEAFDTDPLCYKGKVRARLGYEMMRASQDARARSAELTLPLLVLFGSDDRLVNPQGSRQLYEQASSADKTLKEWLGCRHEIFNEPEKDEVIAFVADWIDQHVGALAPSVVASNAVEQRIFN